MESSILGEHRDDSLIAGIVATGKHLNIFPNNESTDRTGSEATECDAAETDVTEISPTNCRSPASQLQSLAENWGLKLTDSNFAKKMDVADPVGHLKKDFYYPKNSELPKG